MENAAGLVVRQRTQKGEAAAQTLGIPYEAKNIYDISILPSNTQVKTHPHDAQGWAPTGEELQALESIMTTYEESSLCTRLLLACCGCLNLRPLTLNIRVTEGGQAYLIKRPFKCGGWICCPLEMNVFGGGDAPQQIGRIREDFDNYCGKCFEACCTCTYYHKVEQRGVILMTCSHALMSSLPPSLSSCGRTNNFCAATCLKRDGVFDILDMNDQVVAHMQRTYAPDNTTCGAFCRCCYMFQNYMISFPGGISANERALLLASIFQIDYQLFEKTGGDNN
ncbi:unnamed protein product [Chrysoparadoxa australica]